MIIISLLSAYLFRQDRGHLELRIALYFRLWINAKKNYSILYWIPTRDFLVGIRMK